MQRGYSNSDTSSCRMKSLTLLTLARKVLCQAFSYYLVPDKSHQSRLATLMITRDSSLRQQRRQSSESAETVRLLTVVTGFADVTYNTHHNITTTTAAVSKKLLEHGTTTYVRHREALRVESSTAVHTRWLSNAKIPHRSGRLTMTTQSEQAVKRDRSLCLYCCWYMRTGKHRSSNIRHTRSHRRVVRCTSGTGSSTSSTGCALHLASVKKL